jgi:hypothetical protein
MYRKNRDIKPYLLTRSLLPENQETPIHFLRLPVIPEEYFYRRNHFPYPELELTDVSLSIDGEVLKPMTFSYDDLISQAIIGLIEAIDRFDPSRGVKFNTFAYYRIRGAVMDMLRDLDWVPRSLRAKGNDILGGGNWEQARLYQVFTTRFMPLGRPSTLGEKEPVVLAGSPK